MKPAVVLPDPRLDGIRQRRVSLRAAMITLEQALAMPASPSSERTASWNEGVATASEQLQSRLREHIESTEGPDGFHTEILAASPRLSHAVAVLVRDHVAFTELIAKIIARLRQAQTHEDIEEVREIGTDLLSRLSRHRQQGADMIYEAYEYDVGGEH